MQHVYLKLETMVHTAIQFIIEMTMTNEWNKKNKKNNRFSFQQLHILIIVKLKMLFLKTFRLEI